jgi:hypothetical protein
MASSANIGRVLWPKKAKTNEINEMVTKNPSSGFELSRMIILLAPSPHKMGNTIICGMAVEFDSDQKNIIASLWFGTMRLIEAMKSTF